MFVETSELFVLRYSKVRYVTLAPFQSRGWARWVHARTSLTAFDPERDVNLLCWSSLVYQKPGVVLWTVEGIARPLRKFAVVSIVCVPFMLAIFVCVCVCC